MFQLAENEYNRLILQIAISKKGRGGKRKLPYVFTEHGVVMLSAVLRSERAVAMSIFIVRAFVKLREMLATNKELAGKIAEIEQKQEKHGKNLVELNHAVARLIGAKAERKTLIGFRPK